MNNEPTIYAPESPRELSERLMAQSNSYATFSERLVEILKRKPAIWNTLRKELKSDTSADKSYEATADGLEEMELRSKLRVLEKGMSAIKTMLRTLEVEAHNQF